MTQYYRTAVYFILVLILSCLWGQVSPGLALAARSTDLRIYPESPRQGQTLVVTLATPDGLAPPAVTFEDKVYKFYPLPSAANGSLLYRALVGIPVLMPVGQHKLVVGDKEEMVQVQPGGFGVQSIRLPKEKDNFIASPGEEEAVNKAKSQASAEQLWTGVFHAPCKARTSTQFGLRRRVNGRLLPDYFHSGLDYAGAMGAPVVACQRGRVILAHTGWRLHGNIVALDHGQGVVTFYLHLSKILVKQGDVVDAGQVIGHVGATGRASGPHLHFSLYVNSEASNPADWFSPSMAAFRSN